MKDIAAALGVSVVTVSKVLNGKKHISEETTKRVLECAERLRYRANLAAKGLVTGKSKTVGLIVPGLMHGFYAAVAGSLLDTIRHDGYGLVISSSRDEARLEREEIREMVARSVDALVIASCEAASPVLRDLSAETPIILLDRKVRGIRNSAFVGTDNVRVGTVSTQHLLKAGYKRIAYFGGSRLSPSVDREAGYRAAIVQADLRVDDSLVLTLTQNEEESHRFAFEAMKQMLQRKVRPDGVVCYNDAIAYGVVQAALNARIRIPQDFGVVGCGNLALNEFLRVPLTTIDQDTDSLGIECARTAIAMIEARQASISKRLPERIVPSHLIPGKSTRKVKILTE